MATKGHCAFSHDLKTLPFGAYPRPDFAAMEDMGENLLHTVTDMVAALAPAPSAPTSTPEAAAPVASIADAHGTSE